ncbi:hypothetical protein M409DRAFT_66670 [Zasmidium cellare ATCC 36951]|uniref:MPN domain-containing protein n=1 Tax=Zasmidium cellare ATCC 36951 TaxID=1080233 RepID=A0A6A6CGG5_ZASCE|nr:uncharacterized protein M409DRAFT_66670 [Zasmidium cellare ATCC 36951]KAF2166151.1 hypothetical protein M409DRAFT_66670 [Zasmidium cellare ATCC 36951]
MALSRHQDDFSTRPHSVEDIVSRAQNFDFSPNLPLKHWLRSARMLLTEAANWEHEGNLQMAYLYVYRHCHLVLSKLPEHPDYRDPRFKQDLVLERKAIQRNLVKLEQWKPLINQNYERHLKNKERRIAERQRAQEQFNLAGRQPSYDGSRRGSRASIGSASPVSPTQTINAFDNRDFAVDLAHREIRRRDATRQSTTQAGISPATVASRRRGISTRYTLPPALPAKAPLYDYSATELAAPTLPPKDQIATPSTATPSPPLGAAPTTQPSKYTFQSVASTERGTPLRTILLPPTLRTAFLNLAHSNTARNLETCGILCATPFANALFINTLIIPDQTATSDTCDTTEEGDNALFDYCDSHDLLVAGWIHTHPSQSCFLSSRDLHTSSGYQVMLPEAIAIVCAPRHSPDWGCFRLTSPPGLEHVLGCTQQGLFHPHSEGNLYTNALKPGHVMEAPTLNFEVVDLRKGR